MKDIYNHVVYYLFSLVLLCAPPRAVAAEEDPAGKNKHVQERKPPASPPKKEASFSSPPPSAEEQTKTETFAIPETTVTGAQENSYKVDSTTAATKTDTPLRDIPQSVSVVTERVVKSQNAFTLRDALKNVSGLTIAAGEGGRTGDSLTLRGFAANSDIYLDGVKENGQYFRDTFFLERIEALKGPSSVLFGRGTTGGLINIITKKPRPDLNAQGEFTYGSYDFKRGTVDIGGAVSSFLNLRLNALYQDADSFRDFNFTNRWGLAPSLGIALTQDTQLTLQLLHQEEDSVFDYGLPMFRGKPAHVSRDTFYGYPDDRLQTYDTTIATATLTHQLSSSLSVRNSFRYGDYERRYRTQLFGAVTGASTLALVVLCLSGLSLRWPRSTWKWRTWLKINTTLKGRSFLWRLHAVTGTWVLLLYLLAAVTGLFWSYEWYRNSLFALTGASPLNREGVSLATPITDPPDLALLWPVFLRESGGFSTAIVTFPERPTQAVEIRYLAASSPHERAFNYIVLHPISGAVLRHDRYLERSVGAKLVNSVFAFHSGGFWGAPGMVIMMVASLSMPLCAVTGWLLYLTRRAKTSASALSEPFTSEG